MEMPTGHEVIITENHGFKEPELLLFLQERPKVIDIMSGDDFIFRAGTDIQFPSPVTPDEEKANPELAARAFRRRVALHTTAVGATYFLLITNLAEAGVIDLDRERVRTETEVMTLHDLNKIHEIRWRRALGSSDNAYNAAEEHLASLLRRAGYPEESIELAGSIGHNGARDFLLASQGSSPWSLSRQAAYLADELLQETVIQVDPLAKARRVQSDPRYEEANKAGFPEQHGNPLFTFPDGSLRPKFDLQFEATQQMTDNVGRALGIPGSNLGKFLIQKATNANLYTATVSKPSIIYSQA